MIRLKALMPCWVLLLATTNMAWAALDISTPGFTARFDGGALVGLHDNAGNVFVAPSAPKRASGIRREQGDHWTRATRVAQPWANGMAIEECHELDGLPGGLIRCAYAADATTGDLILTHEAQSPAAGVWGVEWCIAGIPLDMNIIVPAHSGLKLSQNAPAYSESFDYPMAWEAQLVIVEGDGAGFYVWAEDTRGIFKRLTVDREEDGWRIGFITMPFAPFHDKKDCPVTPWRINTYRGGWRTAARAYGDWMEEAFSLSRLEMQQPAWAQDIRCCVIMGQDLALLEALPSRLDPAQTMIYLPDWRRAGYDRNYPDYTDPYETLEAFMKKAHALGFRVMLHVNYFGCDPLHPLYAQFEPYHVRSPWGAHEKEWWLWLRAEPEIRFAYINPAHAGWRETFVARMQELCAAYGVDALHLDQTLCLYNDHNGLMDGMSMIEGNAALHRELRAALPHVALSGEGLNERTLPYEAFAQRHVYGINHVDGTWSRPQLAMAHPISSYLFRPFTVIYGYLGCAPPEQAQFYAAWQDAYRHFGVIPTLKPSMESLLHPTGFALQFFDEAALWFRERLSPDPGGSWPPEFCFPFRTEAGALAGWTEDHRLVYGGQWAAATITGAREWEGAGSIPGWRGYDAKRMLGLDPALWYPCTPRPRELDAFHVASPLPEGIAIGAVSVSSDLAMIRTRRASDADMLLASLLPGAHCGAAYFDGGGWEQRGPLKAEDGSFFLGHGDTLHAHPPYRNAGGGVAYARYALSLPKDTVRFVTDIALDYGAVGDAKSDGVTFGININGSGKAVHEQFHHAEESRREIVMDLRPFAGQDVTLELSVHPGPQKNPSFDWARWYAPRIERSFQREIPMVIENAAGWSMAVGGTQPKFLPSPQDRHIINAVLPGAVYLLREAPACAAMPCALAEKSWQTVFIRDDGVVLEAARYAWAEAHESSVGGLRRGGIFVHPPKDGQTRLHFPMMLPEEEAIFHAFAGIRDGSKSEGVVFSVEVNGTTLYEEKIVPGQWHETICCLNAWAGQPIVLDLVVDAAGDNYYDWAHWGEPRLLPNTATAKR